MPVENNKINPAYLTQICEQYKNYNQIDPTSFDASTVKRGLRNSDGTGVVAGVTLIGNVHGYFLNEGERMPIDGRLIYRGIDINDIVKEYNGPEFRRFEEVAYLLLIGRLPTQEEFKTFNSLLSKLRQLPSGFTEDMIIKAPSPDVMNKMARSVLALYSYDKDPDNTSLENMMRQSLELTARLPMIAAHAYHVKRHFYNNESLYIHHPNEEFGTAGNFLNAIRPDKKFTASEAKILDLSLVLHAEHGGGNNSAFSARVLSSTGTDTYSAIAAAIGSLKGPKHGGANIKVSEMIENIKQNVKDWEDDEEIEAYIEKLVTKQAGDKSGLVYGMGHAIYTQSDPRAVLLKKSAESLAKEKDMLKEFNLIANVERIAPQVLNRLRNENKVISANVDMYSGFVYKMLNIPYELYTPLFAISRIVGWCAHRIEEVTSGGRIIRPAYKSLSKPLQYIPMSER